MKKVNEFEIPFRKGDSGPKYMFRGPNIDWGVLVLNPGEKLGAHYHNKVEETFFFLQGEPVFRVNDTEHRVKVGDAFMLEITDKHDIINDTQDVVRMVFFKYPFDPDDKVDCC
jgi:mannose-6-phosphate isomerase-like protein (cupin superfamily)